MHGPRYRPSSLPQGADGCLSLSHGMLRRGYDLAVGRAKLTEEGQTGHSIGSDQARSPSLRGVEATATAGPDLGWDYNIRFIVNTDGEEDIDSGLQAEVWRHAQGSCGTAAPMLRTLHAVGGRACLCVACVALERTAS